MKVIDVNNNPFVFGGDVHGCFEDLVFVLTNKKLKDINFVVCGDFGVGFYKPNYYTTTFKKLNKKLKKRNIHIYAFRGNHDDPEYFCNVDFQSGVMNGVTNIHLVDDYDIIKNDNHSILCIGGARSVDKSHRWKWDFRTQKKVACGWWEGEKIKDIPDNFSDFIKNNKINIDVVCTHSSPEFCEPFTKSGLEFWAKYDEDVIKDCDEERKLLANIFHKLKMNNNIKYWFYGHFHNTYTLEYQNTYFRGLNMFENMSTIDFYYMYDGACN